MLKDKRAKEVEKFRVARIHASGVIGSGHFVWNPERKKEVLDLVQELTLDERDEPVFAPVGDILLEPPYRSSYHKPTSFTFPFLSIQVPFPQTILG
jgi:hypothetical protein